MSFFVSLLRTNEDGEIVVPGKKTEMQKVFEQEKRERQMSLGKILKNQKIRELGSTDFRFNRSANFD